MCRLHNLPSAQTLAPAHTAAGEDAATHESQIKTDPKNINGHMNITLNITHQYSNIANQDRPQNIGCLELSGDPINGHLNITLNMTRNRLRVASESGKGMKVNVAKWF